MKSIIRITLALLCLAPMSNAMSAPCTIQAGADCEFTITVDGRSRDYLLHIPDGYDGTSVALVIDVHGYAHTPEYMRSLSGLYELSDIETFAVAYPRGGPATGGAWWARGFNGSADSVYPGCCGTPSTQKWDDVAMIVAVKNDVATKINIDKNYYSGLSNGSYMGHRILCEAPGEFDAYATTSAALSESWQNCTPSVTRPILYMHGRNDTTQPIAGTPSIAGEAMLSTSSTMAIYASRNSCNGYPSSYIETFSAGTSWCREYSGCAASVGYCELDAPHITYSASGLNVAEVFWDFFSRH